MIRIAGILLALQLGACCTLPASPQVVSKADGVREPQAPAAAAPAAPAKAASDPATAVPAKAASAPAAAAPAVPAKAAAAPAVPAKAASAPAAPAKAASAPAATAPARPAAKPALAKAPTPGTPAVALRKPESAATPAAKPAGAPPLDLKSLEQQLRATNAIGVLTKLSLKNQVDDLLEKFRNFYEGRLQSSLVALRGPFDMLIMKVLSLLQDKDPVLAGSIHSSREALWGILADRESFQKLA